MSLEQWMLECLVIFTLDIVLSLGETQTRPLRIVRLLKGELVLRGV